MLRLFLTFCCLFLAAQFARSAAVVVYLDEEGRPVAVNRLEITDAVTAVTALATPPSASESGSNLVSGVPPETKVLNVQASGETTVVEFSPEIIGDGLDDARLETI